ncbi:MAG TPA: hypothetical protein PKW55_06975 [Spirochaetota bacterium]|nr:hypothetical protein [Spirochaetota bacterium]HOM38742.1 hypothetical protein [Spirochaetota bacterium]HPQ49540.1 hypothetical protein [Spirochaetota bacterium]
MNIIFSDIEKKIIKIWYNSKVYGGHWGDNYFVLPEEEILFNKIMNDFSIEINPIYLRILKYWAEESSDTPEEEELKKKIESL